jgi:hypothetical protein
MDAPLAPNEYDRNVFYSPAIFNRCLYEPGFFISTMTHLKAMKSLGAMFSRCNVDVGVEHGIYCFDADASF